MFRSCLGGCNSVAPGPDGIVTKDTKAIAWSSESQAQPPGAKGKPGGKKNVPPSGLSDFGPHTPGLLEARPLLSLDDVASNSQAQLELELKNVGAFDPTRTAEQPADKVLSGDELLSRGFKKYNADGVTAVSAKLAASPASPEAQRPSASLPLTFMVLDIIRASTNRHRARRASHEEGQQQGATEPSASSCMGGGGKFRNRLVPIFTNFQCRAYFKISGNREYVEVLKKLLKRDPLLTFALQKAVRHLKAGDPKGISHVTPDPSGHSSSLIGMRITPCVWSQEGRSFPALMFEHNVSYNPAVVMPRLMRDYAVLSHVPAILTLIDFQVGLGGHWKRSMHAMPAVCLPK